MLHQGGCVRARALSAWPWLARLSAGRPGAPLFSLHAFSLDPRALACICVSDLFLSRCEGQGLGVFVFGGGASGFRFKLLLCVVTFRPADVLV